MVHPSVKETASRFIAYLNEANEVYRLSIQGIHELKNRAQVVNALHNLNSAAVREKFASPEGLIESESKLRSAEHLAQLAESEITNEFPLLHAHALAGIWGALEAFVNDLVVQVLLSYPATRTHEAIQNIRVPLIEFESLSAEERIKLVVSEVSKSKKTQDRIGVGGFEILLDLVGLGGAVPPEMSKNLLELQQLRHVIVHRGSIADRHLIDRCPWLGLQIGVRVRINVEHYSRLTCSTVEFASLILDRINEHALLHDLPNPALNSDPAASS